MSEVRLIVREKERDWSGTIHGSSADRAIAALSADPVTLAELEVAYGRFERTNANRRFLSNLSAGMQDESYDAGLVIIDLIARLVVVDSTYSSPGPTGAVCFHDGNKSTDTWLSYHLANDWLFIYDSVGWQHLAAKRRQERAARPTLDVRAVFYGRPLIEFVVRESFAAFARHEKSESAQYSAIKEIHAAWLLIPRDDLGGACPREVALERRDHLGWDLQDQSENWSLLQRCPPGLEQSSFAFRYGGFGTHELVKYYDLVRVLLACCWDQLDELEETQPTGDGPESPTVGDFLTSEVPRLEQIRDEWFDDPDPECHGLTPRAMIDHERARIPEGFSGHEAIIDPDCPCCQAMAEMPGPAFWGLDGCNMDEDFAFDIYHRTREDWDAEQRRWEENRKRFNAEWAERERLGVTDSGKTAEGEQSIWSSSFSVGDEADVPLGTRLFGIGVHLAELIVGIRGENAETLPGSEARQFIDQLNRDFGNLRELLQNSEPSLAQALIEPVMNRFSESLSEVAAIRPDLSAKCQSLTDRLGKFLNPRPDESIWDEADGGIPF